MSAANVRREWGEDYADFGGELCQIEEIRTKICCFLLEIRRWCQSKALFESA